MIDAIAISLLIVMSILSGRSKAAMDIIAHKFDRSIFSLKPNQNYWNPKLAWRNKWKNGDRRQGEVRRFSSTLLVWKYSGWHKEQTNLYLYMFLSMITINLIYIPLIYNIALVIIWWGLMLGVFELYYTKIFLKKFTVKCFSCEKEIELSFEPKENESIVCKECSKAIGRMHRAN